MLDGGCAHPAARAGGRRAGHARGRRHRPRQHVRGLRVLQGGAGRGRQAHHRHRGVRHPPGTHRSDKSRVQWGTPEQRSDDVSGSGAYTHMTLLSETTEGMHNLFRLSSISSLEGYYFKPRMDREILQKYSKGLIATTGCRPARSRPGCASDSTTRRGRRPPSSRTSSARRTTSPRSWTTDWRSSGGSPETCCGSRRTSASRSSARTTCTTRISTTRRAMRRCSASSRGGPLWPTRTGSSSTATATT